VGFVGVLAVGPIDARVLRVPRPNRVKIENGRTGSRTWGAPDAIARPVDGYASEISVLPGEAVHLHVSTAPAAAYRVEIYRLGWYGSMGGRLIDCLPSCTTSTQGTTQRVPAPDPVTGEVRAGWPVTDTITVGKDWTSGYYAARLVLPGGGQPASVLFVVKALPSVRSQILVVASVNTWQAYNTWGGKSLYSNGGRPPANHVSFDRPWSPGSQGQFFAWGIHLVRFLEREGYDVSYTTDIDIDRQPDELLKHRLVMVNAHDEYWTKAMRDAYEAARDAGVNLAFMGANNAYWQIRYENDRRTIVAYKSKTDPVADRSQTTVQFRDLNPPRYECSLLGVQHEDAIEHAGDAPRDFAVAPGAVNDPWFAGTGFTATSTLRGLVGPEWDSVVSPRAAWTCRFTSLTTFFHYEGPPGDADSVRYFAPSGARVFSAGSLQFVWGLDDYRTGAPGSADPRLQQFMRNAIADMTAPLVRIATPER
jgi:hypothetical protein